MDNLVQISNDSIQLLKEEIKQSKNKQELHSVAQTARLNFEILIIEMKRLDVSEQQPYKQKVKKLREQLQALENELSMQQQPQPPQPVHQSSSLYAKHILDESVARVKHTEIMIEQSKEIGTHTANQLYSQTEQLQRIDDQLFTIDDQLKRSKEIIKRLFRRLVTNKYIWIFIFGCLVCLIYIIVAQYA